MSGTTAPERRPSHRLPSLSSERIMWIEVVVLAPLAAILVLLAFPSWFEIDWGCVSTTTGVMRTAGDSYIAAFGVIGSLGWLLVVMIALFANVTGSSRFAAYLPVAWFVTLVTSALVAAAAIGPQTCA